MYFEYKTLYITDEIIKAKNAKEKGKNVVLSLPLIDQNVENEELAYANVGIDYTQFPYAIENISEVSNSYFDRLILRFENKPWTILETKRCLVREITPQDVESLYKIYAHPEITAYMENLYENPEDEIAYTKDYIANHYRFYEFGMWIVEDKEKRQIIGRAGLDMVAEKELPQLGFMIRKEDQRKGYASEVCQAILTYAKEELGFDQIEALCDERNVSSIALLKKLGFVETGKEENMLNWNIVL